MRLIATIDDPRVIRQILAHLGLSTEVPQPRPRRLAPLNSSPPCAPDRSSAGAQLSAPHPCRRAGAGTPFVRPRGLIPDDRRYLWAGGLDTSQIFIFDVATDPAKPKLVKTIKTFVKDTGGLVGPHTFCPLPGRMLISALSNAKDDGGRTGLAEYSNDGKFIRTIWMPAEAPYGYDVRVNINLNRMLTSSFSGRKNYMRPFGELVKDAEAMKQFGDSVVVWDFHARKPLQILRVPGAPLELRWALMPNHHYAFTSTALTGQLVLIHQQEDGTWAAKKHRRDRQQYPGGHQHRARRQQDLRQLVRRWDAPRLRRDEPVRRQADRADQAGRDGQHGLHVVGWDAHLRDQLAALKVG
jgi:hypothetical protein